MRKATFFIAAMALAFTGTLLASCDNYKEEAPIRDEIPTDYRLPDPQTLTDSDRAVINAMQDEYDRNASN